MTAELRALPGVSRFRPLRRSIRRTCPGRSSLTIRLACELYDEPQRLCPARVRAHLWPWHQLQNLHSIRENRDERRNADTRTREPMQSSRRAGPRCRETQGLARGSDGSNRALTFGSGSSRCGQASKGVGGMPWRHQKSERGRLRNAWGSCRTSVDPGILTKTQGTETSQYLVE